MQFTTWMVVLLLNLPEKLNWRHARRILCEVRSWDFHEYFLLAQMFGWYKKIVKYYVSIIPQSTRLIWISPLANKNRESHPHRLAITPSCCSILALSSFKRLGCSYKRFYPCTKKHRSISFAHFKSCIIKNFEFPTNFTWF